MKFAVIGTGNIGYCQATLTIGNGYPTVLIGRSEKSRASAVEGISKNFDALIAQGKATQNNKEKAMALLTVTGDYSELAGVDFIFEAVAEAIEIKHEVYENVEKVVSKDTIVASCTSAITADVLAEKATHKGRFIVAHPFQPAHLLPLVELVGNDETTSDILDRAKEILEKLQRQVVVLNKNIEGFIVNRLAQALFRESLYLLEQGVASVADIDKSIKYAVGMRYASIGLLEYFDDVGFELEKAIANTVYPSLCSTTDISTIVNDGIEKGTTGRKATKGLYDWDLKDDTDYLYRKSAPFYDYMDWKLPE